MCFENPTPKEGFRFFMRDLAIIHIGGLYLKGSLEYNTDNAKVRHGQRYLPHFDMSDILNILGGTKYE
jgi:hypothetical protein